MEHWRFIGDQVNTRENIKRAERELNIHRDFVRLGNLSQHKSKREFGDGLVVECQTVFKDEIIKVYMSEKVEKKKQNKRRNRILIGLEYTDGTHGGYPFYGSFPNYNGFGMSIYGLTEKELVPIISIPWKESVPLKGPWKTTFATGANAIREGTPSSPYPAPTVPYQGYYWVSTPGGEERYTEFYSKAQGEESGPYYFSLGTNAKVELRQLVEMDYDPTLYPSLMRKSERRIASGVTDDNDLHWYIDEWHYTTWIEVAGQMIAGPFTHVDGRYSRQQKVVEQIWPPLFHYRGQEDNYNYGDEISHAFAGMVLDEKTYVCLYSVNKFNNCNRYVESEDCATMDSVADYDLTVDEYSGTLDEYPYICCSGTTHEINRDKDVWSAPWGSEGTTGMSSRCVRIFGFSDKIPDDPAKLFYAYSFWEPQFNPANIDEDYPYTLTPVLCRYGLISGGNNTAVEEGYPTVMEGGYYSYDNNTVPGIPKNDSGDNYLSSILMRVYLETTVISEY